jgi:uncharacterized membrane protein YgdD (TMEM256/DUF423 family)
MQRVTSGNGKWLAAGGALYAAIAVALAAYAAHVANGPAQSHLPLAAAIAFGHGVALAALAPVAQRRLARIALSGLWWGVLLFSGSLVGNAVAQWPVALAPFGGSLLIGAWLVYSFDLLRR